MAKVNAAEDWNGDPEEFRKAMASMPPDEFADYLDALPESVLAALMRDTSSFDSAVPATPMAQAQELDPKYASRPHLEYLSDRIAVAVEDVKNGISRQLAVSMPPRTGKSEIISKHLPVWLLRQVPTWKIILMSYSPQLATAWSREVRRAVEEHGPELGLQVASDAGAVGDWETTMKGEVHARSMGQGVTGHGANVLIIDDPIKDYATAHSSNKRDELWSKWTSDIQTRREPPSLTIVVQCMTGDTPVLMPDGSEKPLRDIRVGDKITTYEKGHLATALVLNWASQGYDSVFVIRMSSGVEVRANARHPFLVRRDGEESWVQLQHLTVGDEIVRATRVGEVSWDPSAQSAVVTSAPSAKACACRTTTKPDGLQEFDHLPSTRQLAAMLTSSIATGSTSRSTIDSLLTRMESAQSAGEILETLELLLTGAGFSASTTIIPPEPCAACSVTTATFSQAEELLLKSSSVPLPTYEIAPDQIVAIEAAGVDEVFDIQVERTENFIANGLVSHNTRWHEDDFTGRLISEEYPGDPADWEIISFPAIAEEDDVLGREVGDPLFPPLIEMNREIALAWWEGIKASMSSYEWAALYQQRPSPASGAIFNRDWWTYWTTRPELVTFDDNGNPDGKCILKPDLAGASLLDSWDLNFDDTQNSDFVVGQRWARLGPWRILLSQRRGRWDFPTTLTEFRDYNSDGQVHTHLVEKKANGAAMIATMRSEFSGIKPVSPTTSKEVRARAVTAEVESGHVRLPHPQEFPWVNELLDELREFPSGKHDDQVDVLTQALNEMRDNGNDMGGFSNPNTVAKGPFRSGPSRTGGPGSINTRPGSGAPLTAARINRGASR